MELFEKEFYFYTTSRKCQNESRNNQNDPLTNLEIEYLTQNICTRLTGENNEVISVDKKNEKMKELKSIITTKTQLLRVTPVDQHSDLQIDLKSTISSRSVNSRADSFTSVSSLHRTSSHQRTQKAIVTLENKIAERMNQLNTERDADDLVSLTVDTTLKPVEITYEETGKAWQALIGSGEIDKDPVPFTFTNVDIDKYYEADSGRSTPTHNISYFNDEKIENDTICFLCKELKNEIVYPCRICTRVFHVKCLEERDLIKSDIEKQLVLQAYSNIGWSCNKCHDLSSLIPHEDMLELMRKFEFSNALYNGGITMDEFIFMRRDEFYKQFGTEMSNDDVQALKLRFKLTDSDNSGTIDWVEYMNYECMKRLHNRPAKELVLELSPKEIQRARETFFSFDKDKGGTISEDEARAAYRHWFGLLLMNHENLSEIDQHVNTQVNLVMHASRKKGGHLSEVTWEDFIQEQAIYILVNRPNNPIGLTTSKNHSEHNQINNNKESRQKLSTKESQISKSSKKPKCVDSKYHQMHNIKSNKKDTPLELNKRKTKKTTKFPWYLKASFKHNPIHKNIEPTNSNIYMCM